MVKKKLIGIILSIGLVAGGISGASPGIVAHAENIAKPSTAVNNKINISQKAVVNMKMAVMNGSNIVGYANKYDMAIILGQTSNGYQVITQFGLKGVIPISALTQVQNNTSSQFYQIQGSGTVTNVTTRLNIRNQPTTSSNILGKLQNGQRVQVLGKQGEWFKVSINGVTGFVYNMFLTYSNTNFNKNSQITTKAPTPNVSTPKSTNKNIKPNTKTTKPNTKTTKPNAKTIKPNTKTVKPNAKTTKPSNSPAPTGNLSQISGNMINSAKAYAVPAKQVSAMANGKYTSSSKEVFLTFDDGPSAQTQSILNTLKRYGVHATFFVLGQQLNNQYSKNILKEEILSGNAIGNHSYTHSYGKLYPRNSVNVSAFMNELNQTQTAMRNILGSNFLTKVMRMPGGYNSRLYYKDKNLSALNNALASQGIISVDWNVDSGDSLSANPPVGTIINKSEKNYKDVVLLMHDTKSNTSAALPSIINYYKSHGYKFDVIGN